ARHPPRGGHRHPPRGVTRPRPVPPPRPPPRPLGRTRPSQTSQIVATFAASEWMPASSARFCEACERRARYPERMIRQRRHPAATQSTTRLEAFTDGVFAIAATLLVLDLTTHTIGHVDSDAQLWAALFGMRELFFNFLVSFALLALMWTIHVRQFEYVQRVDAVLTWLNNGRLLFVVLVPFATALTTEYSAFLAARISIPVAFLGVIVFSWLQWGWARRH